MKIRSKINLRYTISFIFIISLVGLFVGIFTTASIKSRIYSYLYANNRARAEHVRTFIEDQKSTALILAAASVYRDFMLEPITSDQYPAIKEKIDKRLIRTLETDSNLFEALIIDMSGKTVASSDPTQVGNDESRDDYFIKGKEGVFFKDVYFMEPNHKISYALAAPIMGDDGEVLGVSVLRYVPDRLYTIVQGEKNLGNSEENFLINNNKFFITPSSFLGTSVILRQKIETKNANDCFDPREEEYVRKNGYAGLVQFTNDSQIVQSKDYRNVGIIGTHAYIPETSWCLISKVDSSELMAFRTRLIIIFLSMCVLAELLFLIVGWRISKVISRPILKLSEGAAIIEKGNLNYNIDIKTNDEIGQLGRSFNKMTATLKQTYSGIEKKVKEQTSAIIDQKSALEKQQAAILNILEDVEIEKNKAEYLASIVKSAEEAVIGKTKEGIITSWNQGAEKMYGYMADEISGKSIKIIAPPEKFEEIDHILHKVADGKRIEHFATIRKRKDGSLIDVSISVAPMKDSAGKIIGVSTIATDITKEKQIDKAKTEFVSLASHQLRTPLSAINWYAEMLLAGDAGKLNKEQKQYLQEVYNGNQRMVDLVNSLLNVSRIELGTFAVEPRPTNLVDIAKSLLNELASEIKEKKLTVKNNFDKTLPKINVDPKLMRMVIQNLLSNAVKYTPEKGKVNVDITKQKSDILIKVADTGYGIPKHQQDKIFTKLFRADNIREKDTEGTGLGLYIVKSVVEQSNGKIWFESEENKGTTFFVTIPLSGMKKKEGTKSLN